MHIRSPRKSVRLSLSKPIRAPTRRPTEPVERKNVHWKDEEVLVEKSVVCVQVDDPFSVSRALPATSESDWEDEKTDESVHLSTTMCSSASTSSRRETSTQRRTRNSKLDPGYLKTKMTTLESLKEADESTRILSDRMNQLPSTSSEGVKEGRLRGIGGERRVPSSQTYARSVRRNSNIGPMRSSRSRRRSSIITITSTNNENAQVHQQDMAGGARRVAVIDKGIQSPFHKPKRISGSRHAPPLPLGLNNANGDVSGGGSRPMWR